MVAEQRMLLDRHSTAFYDLEYMRLLDRDAGRRPFSLFDVFPGNTMFILLVELLKLQIQYG